MLEDQLLLNYGVLGVWTISMLYERYGFQKKMIAVIERNTFALNRLHKN